MLLLNDEPVDYFIFSGGELQVRLKEPKKERATLTWEPTIAEDIILLLLTVNALKHQGYFDIVVDVLYLPYARQDRVCSPGEAFSLEVIVNLLDTMDVTAINFWDIHNSDETLNLFNNTFVHETEIYDIFAYYKFLDGFDLGNLILCAPDLGAANKVHDIMKFFNLGNPIQFEKDRCPETGKILGVTLHKYNRNTKDCNILVIDDICDGGRTFIEVAKELRKHTTEKLYLYVTHGIFSKGLAELLDHYDHIFCHHVLHHEKFTSNDKLTILKEFKHVHKPLISN